MQYFNLLTFVLNKVYNMTKKRGRALIINNENFLERPDLQRKGSNADVDNMLDMMKAFKFEVLIRQDLKAEVAYQNVLLVCSLMVIGKSKLCFNNLCYSINKCLKK